MKEYIEIVDIRTSDEAAEGEVVGITMFIKNKTSSTVSVMVGCGIWHGGEMLSVDVEWPYGDTKDIPAGSTYQFYGYFIMPGCDVVEKMGAYYWSEEYGGLWRLGDTRDEDVKLKGLETQFSALEITNWVKT